MSFSKRFGRFALWLISSVCQYRTEPFIRFTQWVDLILLANAEVPIPVATRRFSSKLTKDQADLQIPDDGEYCHKQNCNIVIYAINGRTKTRLMAKEYRELTSIEATSHYNFNIIKYIKL